MARADRRPRLTLWAAIAAFATGFALLSIYRQRAFSTGRFDLGNMVQAVWATAHGHPLRVTNLRGEQVLRLGAHVDPVLMLFAPLWRLWPSPDMLLVAQAIAIASGALPVFFLARKHLSSEGGGVAFAVAYLLYPPTTWLALNEFHPGGIAMPALLWAFWYLDEDRLVPFALFALLAALCREDVPLVIAGFGIWYAFARRRRLFGASIAVAGVAWTALAVGVVIPHVRGREAAFTGRYTEARGNLGHPLALAQMTFDHRGVFYLLDLLLPLAGLSLLSPIALVALPALALNLFSSTPTQRSIHFHYTAAEIPPLIAAAVLGGAMVKRRWALPVGAMVVVVALFANYRLGAIPLWRAFPGGETLQARAANVTAHDKVAARALALVPENAVASATNSLGAHLSARRRFLSFPVIQDATWIAVDETQPSYGDRVAPLPMATQIVWLRRNPAWRLVFEEDGVLVFHRVLPP